MTSPAFDTINLKPELLETLRSLDFNSMTDIQAQSLPTIIEGKDVIGQAKTGSGKTAAFALGILQGLDVKRFRVQAMVLCPTRELADQVAKEIRTLARGIHNIKVLTLCGGTPMGPQIGSLEHGAHILVGTPGRIEDHISKDRIDLSELKTLVLDEADRMLEMGFQSAMDAVIGAAPTERQTLLFSATYEANVEKVAKKFLRNPINVKVESNHDTSSINQSFYEIADNEERLLAVELLLMQHGAKSSVVFCNTKKEAQLIADDLYQAGFDVAALHGDLEQRDRDQTLAQFSNGSRNVLVATDVAARGLDIKDLGLVINYQLAHDTEVHIHRIGRTGRAGQKGHAASLVGPNDGYKIGLIEDYLDKSISMTELPPESVLQNSVVKATMKTIRINGGKKQKIRPGDILGALTSNNAISGDDIGKINMYSMYSYVAVHQSVAKKAAGQIENGKLKGKKFRALLLR